MTESQSTTPNPPRRRNLLADLAMGLSSFGVLVLLFYFVVDSYFEEPLRSQIKRFVDENTLPFMTVVVPSVFVFGVCVIVAVTNWVQPSAEGAHPSRHRILRRVVCVACWILLFVPALWVGGSAPIWWLLIKSCGSLRDTVGPTLVAFIVIAVGAEVFCHRHRTWVRPLVWGAVAGSVVLLLQCLLTGWNIDLDL
jgi:hypothetical protein